MKAWLKKYAVKAAVWLAKKLVEDYVEKHSQVTLYDPEIQPKR